MVAAVEVAGAVAGDHGGRARHRRRSVFATTSWSDFSPATALEKSQRATFLSRWSRGPTVRRRWRRRVALASAVGIEVFATGGIGGVHRDAPFDESADLVELARTPMIVVCAGAKSILDLPATWERLETPRHSGVGYRTSELPGFFTAETGISLDTRVDNAADVAAVFRAHQALGRRQAMLVVQPPPEEHRLPAGGLKRAVRDGPGEAVVEGGVRGADGHALSLSAVTRLTGGGSLDANLALLEQNAALAAEIAVAACADARQRTTNRCPANRRNRRFHY